MPADFTIVQGDVLPVFSDTLTYSDGTAVDLTGATVKFVMRSLTAAEQATLTGETKVVAAKEGKVSFTPTAGDTATPGNYMANWAVTFPGPKVMTFPTTGYLWVQVQQNLTTVGGAQLLGLPEAKDYLNIQPSDRTHDTKLLTHIEGVRPLIENITGPIIMQVFDEWYEGGHTLIPLRHRPSYGWGTTPVLRLMAASEYRGPIEYALTVVSTPVGGSIYSVQAHLEHGAVTRRTAGGGSTPFFRNNRYDSGSEQDVHIIYAAGQETVPANVRLAALEAIRVNYENTMLVGRGFQAMSDVQEPTAPLGFFLPRRCLELLAPLKRAPAVA